jgi:NADH dehydrogenase
VRILARPPSNYQPLAEAGAQVVFGDLKERASLDPACQSADVVITTANSAQRGGADNPQTVDLEGNRNLIDAAKAAGVKQFIFTSAGVPDPNSPVPFVAAKGKTEAYLQASGVPYTILSPNAFMEFWVGVYIGAPIRQGQPVTLLGEGKRHHSFISAADVAAFALAAIGHPQAINQRLILGGPEPLSFCDAVAVYERVLGKSIPVQHVRPGEPVPGLPEAVWGLAASFDMFDSPMDMTETARTFGVQLTSLEEFVRRSLASAPR